MKRLFALALSIALPGCTSGGGGGNGGNISSSFMLGAHVDPDGKHNVADVTAFQQACGNCLKSESTYPGFAWPKAYGSRWAWDTANGLQPLIVWSPRLTLTTCATYADITAHKWDSAIDADAALAKGIPGAVTISLFAEPLHNGPEICAGTVAADYVAAWNYIVARFAADGVTNVTWIWTLNEAGWNDDLEATWYPGSSVVNIVGIDAYNTANANESFPASLCLDATSLGKPFWITETGAFANEQAAWFSSIPKNCGGASYVFAFDALGNPPNDFRLSPSGLSAFEALGK